MNPKYEPILIPKQHQAVAVDAMLESNIANFDDQGLGKCKQAYDLAGRMFQEGKIDLMVMISKASLKENFHVEVSKDAIQLISKVATGSKIERRRLYKYPSYHILVVSYENAINDNDALLDLISKNRTLLCLDEAHYIKNPDAKRTDACLKLSQKAVRTAIFTGTPIPNNIEDIYTQLKFLGHDVGSDLEAFKQRFGDIGAFKEYLSATMIRRKKENVIELNLPKKKITQIRVNLSTEERAIYEKAVSDMLIQFENKNKQKTEIPINGILSQLVRLTQITSNPGLLIPGYDGPLTKLNKLDSIVSDTIAAEEKIIVWTGYRQNVRLLLERYKNNGAVSIFGEMKKDEIQTAVKKFREDPNTKVLIATPACAREGFTLTSACKAVYLDRNFSLLDWVQSQDRIHRISQTKECEIIVLVAEDSLDLRIDEVLDRKDHIQKFLLGDISEYMGLEKIKISDLKKIIEG